MYVRCWMTRRTLWHDYARDTVKAYFETVAPDVRDQWPLYEKLCRSHVTMQGILNKSFVPTV